MNFFILVVYTQKSEVQIVLQVKKEAGFSTFLRGCNPVPMSIAIGTIKSVHFRVAKIKQFFTKPKIRLLLTAKL